MESSSSSIRWGASKSSQSSNLKNTMVYSESERAHDPRRRPSMQGTAAADFSDTSIQSNRKLDEWKDMVSPAEPVEFQTTQPLPPNISNQLLSDCVVKSFDETSSSNMSLASIVRKSEVDHTTTAEFLLPHTGNTNQNGHVSNIQQNGKINMEVSISTDGDKSVSILKKIPTTKNSLAITSEIQHYDSVDYDNFEIIDDVEWGPRKGEPGYDDQQELSPRPRRIKQDPCGCQPVGIEYTETGIIICPEANESSRLWACIDDSCILFAIQEECGGNCEAGPTCGNKRLQRKHFCDVEVFDAGVKGKGLRLAKGGTCKKGNIVCEYVGRAVKSSHLPALFAKYERDRRLYIMALGDGVYLDARNKGGLARYINHSCDPNCRVERWKVKGVIRAAVVALRDIEPQEEFTFDYQWERKRGHAPTICHCGTSICRGTLEAPKSLEEQDLQKELEGHWEGSGKVDHSIVNRTVQVYSKEHQEYFIGEVTGYDTEKQLHCIFYRHDMNEVWEDLSKEEWMILSEKKDEEQFRIARKKRRRVPNPGISIQSLKENTPAPTIPSLVKNYIYVQTPVKEAFWSHHLIERCERNCSVRIQAEQFARPPLSPNPGDPEEIEKYSALDTSLDGTVWKLTITGTNIPKALVILEKNRHHLERKLATADDIVRTFSTNSIQTTINNANRPLHDNGVTCNEIHEVIFPRVVADAVKRRIHTVREKSRNVTISFLPSDSKSKQFAKLSLEGPISSDIELAKENLWAVLLSVCIEANLPLTPSSMFRDLGFFGCTLSSDQFRLLCNIPKNRLSTDAWEDLNESSFVRSFESTYQCSIWIQSHEDQGRIDSSNKVINEPNPDSPRNIFFGCPPKSVARLASLIQTRANELARGVKYVYLGLDRVYQALMMKNGGKLFDYVNSLTGAQVTIDPMTGDHLRIDGRLQSNVNVTLDKEIFVLTEGQRADLAEEVLRLQIEVYRDHCTRQFPWIFGRDWTLVAFTGSKRSDGLESKSGVSSIGTLDRKTVVNCGGDIAEIVARCALPVTVAGHAALILHRFVYAKQSFITQMKSREAVLACVFLANKTQLTVEWKQLEIVLEAGYKTYYPGAHFDSTKEEAIVLEERVIAAEKEILEALSYDVFWQNVDGLRVIACGSGKMKNEFVDGVLEFAFSGQVLSAGAELWLKYGVEYIFAVAAAFLKADLTELLPALSLIPLKVYQAAELLVESAKLGKPSSPELPSNTLLEGGKERLDKYLPRIKEDCIGMMKNGLANPTQTLAASISKQEQHYRSVAESSCRCKILRGVPFSVLTILVSAVDKIAIDSSCNIFIGRGPVSAGTGEILLQGSWRSIAVACHLLQNTVSDTIVLPPLEDLPKDTLSRANLQAKSYPGLLSSNDIETSEGWENSILFSSANIAGHLGGKYYVAAKIGEASLRNAGTRWLIPPKYASSPSGALTDMCFPEGERSHQLSLLGELAASLGGKSNMFSLLSLQRQRKDIAERSMPVSVQRWPPEKVLSKEIQKWKKAKVKSMQTGFSPSALQEMQLLREIHSLIPSAQCHPNFVLPVGVAIPTDKDDHLANRKFLDDDIEMSPDDGVFSLFRSNDDNEKTVKRSKKIKESPSLIFNPAPFTLHRILSRRVKVVNERISRNILAAWFHDCISMMAHCHLSNVVLCTLQLDQIMIDQNGVAKLGCLYRCRSLPDDVKFETINESFEPARSSRKKDDIDNYSSEHYVAPETLLGCTNYSKESDVWAFGSLFANLLLNKPMFSGRDRESFLTSQYKIVGTPARSNFPDAVRFPYYFKPAKKYVSTVEKALRKLLKDEAQHYEQAIDLIAKMLRLDPSERCTALEALDHEWLRSYRENCNSNSFQEQYAVDWLQFKRNLMYGKAVEESQADGAKALKRSAVFISAEYPVEDDLYEIDELVSSSKKRKD